MRKTAAKDKTEPQQAPGPLQQAGQGPASACVGAFALLMAAVLPLWMSFGINTMAGSKALWFLLHLALLALAAAGAALWQKRRPAPRPPAPPAVAGPGLALLAFAWAVVLATIFSPYRHTALAGWPGRYMGMLLLLGGCLACFAAGSAFPRGGLPRWQAVFCFTSALVALLALLNFFGLDPLNLYQLNPYYYLLQEHTGLSVFLSTLGNTNTLGAYLCLALPLAAGGLVRAGGGRAVAFYAACTVLGWLALLCASSDSALLALAAVGLVALCLRGLRVGHLCRLLPLAAGLGCAAGLLGLMQGLVPPPRHALSGLAALLCRPAPAFAAALAALLGALLVWRRPRLWQRPLHRAGRVLALCAAGLLLLAALAANTGLLPLPAGLANALRFGDAWGSSRGAIWRVLLQKYSREFTPLQWLFGIGPDGVAPLMEGPGGAELFSATGLIIDAAHNEYLQLLLTLGAFGLAAWLAVLVTHLRFALSPAATGVQRVLGLAALAYAVQAFFGIATTSVWPLLCLTLGLARTRAAGPLRWNARMLRGAFVLEFILFWALRWGYALQA